jgi:putative DNA methylase
MAMPEYPKRLIEVDLPIKRISAHARREKSIRHGHISTLHIWWARRPLAACRAVICAALWPDPADPFCPQRFRDDACRSINQFARNAATNKDFAQHCSPENWAKWQTLVKNGGLDPVNEDHLNILRNALLDFIADFSNWDNSTVKEYLETSRALTQAAHEALGGEPGTRPLVVDPFAGGGSIPLEALRVGADAFASDLNPVPVLLNKVVLEYIPRYGAALKENVAKLCRQVEASAKCELAPFYPDEGQGSLPLAFIWARTILSEGPGTGDLPIEVPLISSMWLSKKPHRRRALRWERNSKGEVVAKAVHVNGADGVVRMVARPQLEVFEPTSTSEVESGTVRGGSATCPVTGFTTPAKSVRRQLSERKGGAADARLLAVVTIKEAEKGRIYRIATDKDGSVAACATQVLERKISQKELGDAVRPSQPVPGRDSHRAVASLAVYGIKNFGDLFTGRQTLALLTLTDCIQHIQVAFDDQTELAKASKVLVALMLSKLTDYCSSLASWSSPASQETVRSTFGRQTLAMVWDFAEAYPFAASSGGWDHMLKFFLKAVDQLVASDLRPGTFGKANATASPLPSEIASCFFTDPPYYDSIAYAELSDYFYLWLQQVLKHVEPEIFSECSTPKSSQAIVWHPASQTERESYEDKMRAALAEGRRITVPGGIGIVVFAHKSTAGWEAQLQSIIGAGWVVTASWPIDTERSGRTNANNTASLASSIHLVCRPRENIDGSVRTDLIGDWREVLTELPNRIHEWMPRLSSEGVVGGDAIFACLGPALEIFSRHERVEKANGGQVTLKEYLEYVWAAVAKEALNMIFAGADATGFEEDARLTAMWLWTLSTGANGSGPVAEETGSEDEEEGAAKKSKISGYALEYDAARKIAQGLGAHLERLEHLVEINGETARLLPVSERARYLFGKNEGEAPTARRGKPKQLALGDLLPESEQQELGWGDGTAPKGENTVLDRVHQSMLLFQAGRSEALKRFLVDGGAGQDQRFWRLAQALSALYPASSDEKRWVDGVLARKKGLGF